MNPTSPRPLVLIVDEDARSSRKLAQMLREDGYDVETAFDGAVAIARLTREPIPDALITDTLLPHADGVSIARFARARRAGLGLVFATGYPELAFRASRELEPPAFVVVKPVDYADLTEALARAVVAREPESAPAAPPAARGSAPGPSGAAPSAPGSRPSPKTGARGSDRAGIGKKLAGASPATDGPRAAPAAPAKRTASAANGHRNGGATTAKGAANGVANGVHEAGRVPSSTPARGGGTGAEDGERDALARKACAGQDGRRPTNPR